MPALVMLPLIQCHHTRGLALFGGFRKPFSRASPVLWAATNHTPASTNMAATMTNRLDPRIFSSINLIGLILPMEQVVAILPWLQRKILLK